MKIHNRLLLIIALLGLTIACITEQTGTPAVSVTPTALPEPQITLQDSSSLVWMQIPLLEFAPTLNPNTPPAMAIDALGQVHFFWNTYTSSGDAFVYHAYTDGSGNWIGPIKIAETLGYSEIRFAPLVGPDNRIHLLWFNSLKFGGPYRLMYANFDGIAWSAEEEIYRSETDSGMAGKLFFDAQSALQAVVDASDNIKSHYFLLTRTESGWSAPTEITPNWATFATWSMLPDNTGIVHFLGKDSFNQKILLASSQTSDVTQTGTTIETLELHAAIDNEKNIYLHWSDQVPVPGGSVKGLYFQCLDSNFTAWPQTTPSGEFQVYDTPIVAQTSSLQSIFGWSTTDGQIQLLAPHGCPQADLWNVRFSILENKTQSLSALAVNNDFNKVCVFTSISPGSMHELYCANFGQ